MGPADSEEATPAQDRSTTRQTPEVVLTQEVVLTVEEVSVVAVAVLTEAVVAVSVEEADLTAVAVPAQAGVVALPEADLTNRPLPRGLIAKRRRGRAVHNQSCRPFGPTDWPQRLASYRPRLVN